ncbi:hypothetical protein GA562_25010, partial [Bacteroides xylanisolvens]|uniref:helix-turn-helix transcriptional regulator n=1 Tax=Bacteroides xylanisolvens TaxID=371601 RepID=UPI00125EAB11
MKNIDDELLSPSSIAEFVGVSKATLYRKFKEIIDRDIPKIIKFKATNSLRVSCLFCIFKH